MSIDGVVVEHEGPRAEQRAERRPLPARVHQRPERERDELARTRVAGGEERADALVGRGEHGRDELLGRLRSAGPPGFPPPSAAKKMSSWRHTTPLGRPVVPPV